MKTILPRDVEDLLTFCAFLILIQMLVAHHFIQSPYASISEQQPVQQLSVSFQKPQQ